MKKLLKSFLSMIAVVAMVLSLTTVVNAEGGKYSITINNSAEGHTYEAYQIFKGDLVDGILSNIEWGENVDHFEFNNKTNAKDIAALLKDNNVDSFAKEANKYLISPAATATVSENSQSCIIDVSTVGAGYYLIKDKDDSLNGSETYTKFIIKVVGKVVATPKSAVPSFEKKIKDTNDSTGVTSEWQDSADYDIGDSIPFQLKGTVPSNYGDYTEYYFAFHDIEESGLTFVRDTLKVYVDGTPINSGYQVKTDNIDGCTFEVVFSNLKAIDSVQANSTITVEYNSILNENAVLGSPGNVNKAKLEFSNNPNIEQDGTKGETNWDNVIVFTYQVIIDKVDQDGDKLTGAEFILCKKMNDGSSKEIQAQKNEDGTQFVFKGLDDGDYVLKETKTPDKYNTISDIEFTVNANHTITWNDQNRTDILTDLTGDCPSGTIDLDSKLTKGSLTGKITNTLGSSLPETGGIGNYVFYGVGGVLMMGAAYYFVRKRTGKNI